MKWNYIRNQVPKDKECILFYTGMSYYGTGFHVGFWSDYENGVEEYSDGQEGKKWSVTYWIPISELVGNNIDIPNFDILELENVRI